LARRRCAGLANVRLVETDGRDLAALPDACADLVLAADVFPYLVIEAGDLAAAHVAEAARVLRPGGSLVILNFSYRDDLARDRAEVVELADRAGFIIRRFATGDFALWDAATFHLTRSGPSR
jgi:ubiquinone/menaquinone biosynthesis C-methylase UbiE